MALMMMKMVMGVRLMLFLSLSRALDEQNGRAWIRYTLMGLELCSSLWPVLYMILLMTTILFGVFFLIIWSVGFLFLFKTFMTSIAHQNARNKINEDEMKLEDPECAKNHICP